jgi:hypothetical protein
MVPSPPPAAAGSSVALLAAAADAWRLQLALAWTYPRFVYALWSQAMTLRAQRPPR